MITIKDIAQISGYSISTVSRVINNRTDVSDAAKEKIREVIREQNYQPNENARMLKQSISTDISVIVRGNRSIFLESILEEIQIRTGKHGESINVHFIGETDRTVSQAQGIHFSGRKRRPFPGGILSDLPPERPRDCRRFRSGI